IVQQWLGRDAEARAALAAVLDDPRTPFSERRKLQAELRRAILELATGNIGAAAIWAGQAERRCATTSCEYAATILNVRAQVELDSGHAADAARLAQAAAERSRGAAGRAETANALRTRGRARLAQREATAALEPLKQALELDREIGDPRKILADLAELARAADAAGDAALRVVDRCHPGVADQRRRRNQLAALSQQRPERLLEAVTGRRRNDEVAASVRNARRSPLAARGGGRAPPGAQPRLRFGNAPADAHRLAHRMDLVH